MTAVVRWSIRHRQCLECRPPLVVQIGGLFGGLAVLQRREHLGSGLYQADAFCRSHGVLAGELQRMQCRFVEWYETIFQVLVRLPGSTWSALGQLRLPESPRRLMTVFTKYLIFSALLLLTAIANWLVIYYQVWLPHLFIPPSRSWTTCTRAGYACPVKTLGRVFLVELSQEVQDF